MWDNIVPEAAINESNSTQKLCLQNIVKLYLRVSFPMEGIISANTKSRKNKQKASL